MEVGVLDDTSDEWLDKPGKMLEDQDGCEEGDVDRRYVTERINRMPSCPTGKRGTHL